MSVRGDHLALALGYFDRSCDVFEVMVSILEFLEGITTHPRTVTLRPQSPLGDEANQGLRAEAVDPGEVLLLLRAQLHPFGPRVLRSSFGRTREEQIEQMVRNNEKSMADLRSTLIEIGASAEQLDTLDPRSLAEQMWEQLVPDDEGIEIRDRS